MKNLEKLMQPSAVRKRANAIPNSKKLGHYTVAFCLAALSLWSSGARAQCGAGYQQATLNWDFLDFFVYSGWYVSAGGYLPSNAPARTQNFAFGTQRLTITHDFPDANSIGDNTNHTGEAGTFGDQNASATDADVQFVGNGTITLTFENEVTNLRFSMYDIDRSHRVQLDARNAANVAQNVTMATFAGTVLTITNNNTPNARVDATAGSAAGNNSLAGAVNITVAGPVRTITISLTNFPGAGGGENGDVWLSDILACSVGTFPNNYYQVSRPFTGQPGYVLHAYDESVYAVDPATGITKLLFTVPSAPGFVNSMGYDPYNRILYFVYSLTANAGTNTALMKYDFNTQTISTVLADVRTIGVQLVTSTSGVSTRGTGVESGAGAFYNGSYYIGIETPNRSATGLLNSSGRESVVYRIDFNASGVPTRASQVFAVPTDNGTGTLVHDWSDFAISNGILYDFDGAGSGAQYNIHEYNMLTGATTVFGAPGPALAFRPSQNTTAWDEAMYNIGSTTYNIARYNKGLGTANTALALTPAITPAPSMGDAGEAFRPLMDFGDAPASYDPDPLAPAVHETNPNLRIGSSRDIEWLGQNSALADGDGADEDGLGAAPPLLNYLGTLNYSITVNVFNNTGANARLVGWLDYNFNGVFDAGEGVSALVTSSAVTQSIALNWNSIVVPNTSNVRTFIRFRLAPVSDGLTTANPTGYFANGEVEDYPVLIGVSLPNAQLNFQAARDNTGLVKLKWEHVSDIPVDAFQVQKSQNGRDWNSIGSVDGGAAGSRRNFSYEDPFSQAGYDTYYRLNIRYTNGETQYSNVLRLSGDQNRLSLKLSPNPADDRTTLTVFADQSELAHISLVDQVGRVVWNRSVNLSKGNNAVTLDGLDKLSKGLYHAIIKTDEKTETVKLMIQR